MGLLSYFSPVAIAHSSSSFNKSIDVIERFSKYELYVNGIQQSGPYTIRLWKNGLKDVIIHSLVKQILVLGVGGGTLFPMLHKRFPEAHITAVDIDHEIISFYKKYFAADTNSYTTLVCKDARGFIKSTKQRFDLIIVDLYIGNDVPEFVTEKSFFTTINKNISPAGNVLVNYFTDTNQWKKSQKLFITLSGIFNSVVRKQNIRNVFLYCGKIG
jgi:spermidine synthase